MCDDQKGCCKGGAMGQGHDASQGCHWNNKCGCPHHMAMPMLFVLVGLTFLLGNLGIVSAGFVGLAWPVLVILIGLQKMMGLRCKCWGGMCKSGEKM